MSAREKLEVYLNGARIGALLPARSGMRFQYDESVCDSKMGSPLLSTALPVQADPFDSLITHIWFSGLLPEDARLEEISRYFGVGESDYDLLLREIGWECAGAVAVYPEGRGSLLDSRACEPRWIELPDLIKRLSSLPAYPFDDASSLRVSLSGFQEKMCVVMSRDLGMEDAYARVGKVGLPVDGSPTTHILKPQPARFPGMIKGEAWAMTAASFATETARVALLEAEAAPSTLIVERYDRAHRDGALVRIHQEDCAQALGIEPKRKYCTVSSPKKSDPTFAKIAELLKRYAIDPELEMACLLRQMVVNVALGNVDAHAKNYALLHPSEATVKMAPLYDVVPAREITPQVLNMGLRIGNQIKLDSVSRDEVIQEARSWGLAMRIAEAVVSEALDALRLGIERANDRYPDAGDVHAEPALKRMASLLGGR